MKATAIHALAAALGEAAGFVLFVLVALATIPLGVVMLIYRALTPASRPAAMA